MSIPTIHPTPKRRRPVMRLVRLACAPAIAALALGALAVPAHAASGAAYAQTCWSTTGFSACIHSTESWNGSSARSSGRSYSCSNTPVLISDCHNHTEGSYWNASVDAWEDWANASFTSAASPYVKDCVYLRLDVQPNGHHWTQAFTSGPRPFYASC